MCHYIGPAAHRHLEAPLRADQFAGARVVDDNRHQTQRHRLQHDAAAELADRGEGQQVVLCRDVLHLLMGDPAVQGDGIAKPGIGHHLAQRLHHRAVAEDIKPHPTVPQQGRCRLDQHVGALVGHEAPDETGADRQGARLIRHTVEAGGIDGVLGFVDTLVTVGGGDLGFGMA